ncbi:cob(I)yrinic acid a,c-diamide adenosyltransferase [Patescibacteria group bacterium]
MRLYSRTGDTGKTSLFGGQRVSKAHARVQAYGTVDEANSLIGWVCATPGLDKDIKGVLHKLMHDLFDVGSELATPPSDVQAIKTLGSKLDSRITQSRIEQLEKRIDQIDSRLPELKTFILPTGSEASSRLQVTRAVMRRAERDVALLAETGESVRPELQQYLNRASDLFFALARLCNARLGQSELPWQGKKN